MTDADDKAIMRVSAIVLPIIMLLCLASMIYLTASVDEVSLLVPMSIGDLFMAVLIGTCIYQAKDMWNDGS